MAPNVQDDESSKAKVDLKIPEWLSEEYFKLLLRKDVPDYKKIKSFIPKAATAPGDNYTSTIFRIDFKVEKEDDSEKQISYILKTTLESKNAGSSIINSMNLFPREKLMYQQLLPAFENLYKSAGLILHFGPACLQVEETLQRITLVMEDLKCTSYKNADRLNGLDMPHMTRVLHKLAEFHAASARYYELNGPYDKIFDSTFFNMSNREQLLRHSSSREKLMKRAFVEWGLENADYYIEKMPSAAQRFDEGMRMNVFDPNEFNVLNHGDAWVNNIMFNYKPNGDIDETLFVDFQLCKWGTPAQDLWYMIVTSAAHDIKVQEFDHFVRIYHNRLEECLKLLNYSKPIPTLKELHVFMLKYGFWGLMAAQSTLAIVLYPSDKDSNIESMMRKDKEGEDMRYRRLCNPLYGKAMCQLYPFFDNKGLFELSAAQ